MRRAIPNARRSLSLRNYGARRNKSYTSPEEAESGRPASLERPRSSSRRCSRLCAGVFDIAVVDDNITLSQRGRFFSSTKEEMRRRKKLHHRYFSSTGFLELKRGGIHRGAYSASFEQRIPERRNSNHANNHLYFSLSRSRALERLRKFGARRPEIKKSSRSEREEV